MEMCVRIFFVYLLFCYVSAVISVDGKFYTDLKCMMKLLQFQFYFEPTLSSTSDWGPRRLVRPWGRRRDFGTIC